jgi:hypothetical protein
LARKFLYVVAILIVLALAAAFAYRMFGPQMIRAALVPTTEFAPQPDAPADAYADPAMWFSRPGKGADDPALWTPEDHTPSDAPAAEVFFIHPTSYLTRDSWNAPLDDAEANGRALLFVKSQASAFNGVGRIWAPRYRQATFGAFLTTQESATLALDLAYEDVLLAFDRFLSEIPADRPIILAGHSQGALHLVRLLRERVAGQPVAARIVAAYAAGWPISTETDLAALGLPGCDGPDQAGCILSWQSFAEPADPALVIDAYDETTGFDGRPRRDTPFLCVNPLTGAQGSDAAPAGANLGTLYPSADLTSATISPGRVGARCDERGFLLIGEPPAGIDNYVLPGNNYHVFDYTLFWANVRADAARRLAAFQAR